MVDLFRGYTRALDSPAQGVFTPAQSDTVDLAITTRAIRVDVGGDVKLTGVDGVTTVCKFASGETRPISATRIWSTGTTATGIEGMY